MKCRLGKRLLLVCVGLFLGLILAEVALRVYGIVDARRASRKRYVDTHAAAGTIRMAVLGGSTSNGSPYTDVIDGRSGIGGFNLLSVTRFLLETRYGCSAVEIDNYAGPNWSAQTTIDHYCERPGPRPDVLILCTGQNETTQYYSPNMVSPPAFLSPLARLQFGNLLLRRLFTKQVEPTDQRYSGTFFSDNIIPSYERAHNLARYHRSVERLIRHAADEGIFLIIVIPQSNYLFPPTRSVYRGPADRKGEALRLFKQACEARYVDDQPDRALALLNKLLAFCQFADLFYELGQIHYSRGELDEAISFFRRARETDGFPICITPAYRTSLHELVAEYAVPYIDLDAVIRKDLRRSMPDYTSFLDSCHLRMDVYLALSRATIRVLRESGFDKLSLPYKDLNITPEEWSEHLGITPEVWGQALLWESNYHVSHAAYTFRKLNSLIRARSYLHEIQQRSSAAIPDVIGQFMATADRLIRAEYARMRKWVHHDGPMPLGISTEGKQANGFGAKAYTESSLGDAMASRGEMKLAVAHYRAALEMDPDHVKARLNLGAALCNLQQFEEAIQEFDRVLELDPQCLSAHRNLGKASLDLGRFEEAVVHHREAVRLAPENEAVRLGYYVALNKLAWRLATALDARGRDGARAVKLGEEVCSATGDTSFEALDTLAAAYAEDKRFEDAVATATRALTLARQYSNPMADAIVERVAAYRAGRPWREASKLQSR